MPTLTIRNVPAEDVAKLKARAKANNRSLEAELREIVDHAANARSADIEKLLERAERIRALTPEGVTQTDSVTLVREGRRWLDAKARRLAKVRG